MRRVWKRSTEDEIVEVDPGALSGIFASPQWLRDLGFSAWLLVGVGAAGGADLAALVDSDDRGCIRWPS
jgi:hypothetical protein